MFYKFCDMAFKSKLWFLKHMQNIEQYVVYVSTIFTELLV